MRYQPKGLLHSKRFTTNPRDCGFCGKPLPIPHPTSQRMHDECRHDPARLEAQRRENRKRERARDRAQRAARPAPAPVMRICRHPLKKKDGPTEKPTIKIRGVVYATCGAEFEAKPRIANGVNRGVHADQQYCLDHQTPKAVAHRQWLNRDPVKSRKTNLAYRHRNLPAVRARQRAAAKAKRARVAAILARGKILANVGSDPQKILREMIAVYLTAYPTARNSDVRKIFTGASDATIKRAGRLLGGVPRPKGRPRKS